MRQRRIPVSLVLMGLVVTAGLIAAPGQPITDPLTDQAHAAVPFMERVTWQTVTMLITFALHAGVVWQQWRNIRDDMAVLKHWKEQEVHTVFMPSREIERRYLELRDGQGEITKRLSRIEEMMMRHWK